ncbi:wax ester/triacylglycerol synthase family O-acyltransferase [Curvibacter sp. APW13]|uniref:wax ester/triacylglycerol synthase family O-acyltransferase n=1 Tax=Curvibacter sp. APW13 TaxID=3077236 RepID=UPI0028DE0923|nr:wax ester/triacylglycerol synthase family O-acyltransferase [Curvibacter sp. APW13]MDT8990231.1 wax ester/triacylglycerol synthase family O-acyltransferase [Curvibacter sp. APW13]
MRQLSEHDAAYIYSDSAHANSNVTLVHIYDQSTAPGGVVRFKQILSHVESRLDRMPLFRQKIVQVPLNLDYPYWVEDDNFQLEYHVRHIALPKPGDWRQFCIQSSRIHARPLDLSRPLWEMYVIEGLDSFLDLPQGSFAILLKIHHAAIDVEHGNEITRLLHDLTPEVHPAPPTAPWFPEDPPGDLTLLWRAGFHMASWPLRLWRPVGKAWQAFRATAEAVSRELRGVPPAFPMTRFNTEVSSQRVFETRRFALDEFKQIRTLVADSTVHDVVLAVCAGGLRAYLEIQDELPKDDLVAAVPVAVQSERVAGQAGPRLSWVRLGLATGIEDPVERLAHIQQASQASSTMVHALSARELTSLAEQVPSMAFAATSKMLRSAAVVSGEWAPLANCAITNIPGSREPLYLLGARLTYLSAIMPVHDGMGLVFSVTGYGNTIVVSFTACAEQVPDPEVLAQCIRNSFQEYLALARKVVVAAPAKRATPSRRPAGASKRPARVVAPRRSRATATGASSNPT